MVRQEYEDKDIQEILRRAVREEAKLGSDSQMLRAAASELGISEDALAQAEVQYLQEKNEKDDLRDYVKARRRGFFEHLGSYVIVNAFLIAINFITGEGEFWAIYPILGWGIGLAFHAMAAFARGGESFERDFRLWRRRRHQTRHEEDV